MDAERNSSSGHDRVETGQCVSCGDARGPECGGSSPRYMPFRVPSRYRDDRALGDALKQRWRYLPTLTNSQLSWPGLRAN